MPKEEWGTKRVCPTTGRRFYDLNRDPIVSPYTGEVVTLDTGKPSRSIVAEKPAKPAKTEAVIEEDETEEVVLEDDDDDSEVDLGDDVLEDDDVALDDIADVASDEEDT